jgi:hypothetical protein
MKSPAEIINEFWEPGESHGGGLEKGDLGFAQTIYNALEYGDEASEAKAREMLAGLIEDARRQFERQLIESVGKLPLAPPLAEVQFLRDVCSKENVEEASKSPCNSMDTRREIFAAGVAWAAERWLAIHAPTTLEKIASGRRPTTDGPCAAPLPKP